MPGIDLRSMPTVDRMAGYSFESGSLPDSGDHPMPSVSPRTPSYRLHKPTGQAVVTLSGQDRYLGKHGTAASLAEYDRVIAEWLAGGRAITSREAAGLVMPGD